MTELKQMKRDIRAFVGRYYTTDMLINVIDNVRAGIFTFSSCCCLIGVVTANHPLAAKMPDRLRDVLNSHYQKARALPFARAAEDAYFSMGYPNCEDFEEDFRDNSALRNRRLLPILLAELRVRSHQPPNVERVESAHR